MGNKRSGVTSKRRTLPRRYTTGGLDRLDRRATEARTVLEGAEQVIADAGGKVSLLRARAAHRVMVLDVMLCRDERALLEGREIDRPAYVAGVAAWQRLATAIGFERVAKLAERLPAVLARLAAENATPPSPVAAGTPSCSTGLAAVSASGTEQATAAADREAGNGP